MRAGPRADATADKPRTRLSSAAALRRLFGNKDVRGRVRGRKTLRYRAFVRDPELGCGRPELSACETGERNKSARVTQSEEAVKVRLVGAEKRTEKKRKKEHQNRRALLATRCRSSERRDMQIREAINRRVCLPLDLFTLWCFLSCVANQDLA